MTGVIDSSDFILPSTAYEAAIADADHLREDDAQRVAMAHLDRVSIALAVRNGVYYPGHEPALVTRIQHWFARRWGGFSHPVQGLYMWGGVGRGKTFLMDLFYENLPIRRKMRLHFHHFMKKVHDQLLVHKGERNPMNQVASDIAAKTDVICFDEFVVNDVADAMCLALLFGALFKRGVALVTTSNIEPANLYEHGLQRAEFLPAIALLERYTDVLNVDSGADYRLAVLEQKPRYHCPLGGEQEFMLARFEVMSRGKVMLPREVEIEGRVVLAEKRASGVAWFTFDNLCGVGRSQRDYLALSQDHYAILLSGVFQMTGEHDDMARRFIDLVDELYDSRINLIISSAVPIEDLYIGKRLDFKFERTRSRLIEMQGVDYWRLEEHVSS